jgi:hypothetical protein
MQRYKYLPDLIGDMNSFIFNLFPSLEEKRGDIVKVEKSGEIIFEVEFKWNPDCQKKMYFLMNMKTGEIYCYDKVAHVSHHLIGYMNKGKLILMKDGLPVKEFEFQLINNGLSPLTPKVGGKTK